MTWKHVTLIVVALTAVAFAAHTGSMNFNGVAQLATVVISGTLGHAGTQGKPPTGGIV